MFRRAWIRRVTFLWLLTAVAHPIYYALYIVPLPPAQQIDEPSFAACLLIKDDNDLLPEWLAYHYTVLPLRHVVIAVDPHSVQDPAPILQRWQPYLRYTIWQNGDDSLRQNENKQEQQHHHHHHHALVQRQKEFIKKCSEYLKHEGAQWTAFIDTDEYVIPNRLNLHNDEQLVIDGHGPHAIQNISWHIRQHLPPMGDATTVAEILTKLQFAGLVGSCYTLPRLLVGALENRTCHHASRNTFPPLSTLRFFQHAVKGDFRLNKFGKVWMDLSQISSQTIQSTVPRNIHRPYKDNCGPGAVHFPDAFFYINHYLGSWERYSARSDPRRNREEWEKRAFVDDGSPTCESGVYEWLPRFVEQVGGEARARYLLEGT
ncbi:hypothetical protein FisN_30Lh036 [Fistulifera solaris]|uniref:Glycosyltransferase family 92 protein n=1 Tax=Fistulifera solaris TaxID=1519565 RepID=A0A1Z5JIB0_FISSO|nr:hypothetical protein FisN_30Lh036 [Fistulifera solaris]|eukprot:GAX13750.1 hypothetical protein FisN_30Lh036 [Fistulifera solaris]